MDPFLIINGTEFRTLLLASYYVVATVVHHCC